MGRYINQDSTGKILPAIGNAKALIIDGAEPIDNIKDFPYQEGIVCVVSNGLFDAAGYAFSESEFEAFKMDDPRPKKWLLYKHAAKLAN